MAIPTRAKYHSVTTKTFVFNDNVFQNLIQRMTNVDGAVGIGRAIRQGEASSALLPPV